MSLNGSNNTSTPATVDEEEADPVESVDGSDGALADEVRRLVEKKFTEVPVFERMLKQSAEGMDRAAARMQARLQDARELEYDAELEDLADAATRSPQDLALKRMDQLLDALKPDKDVLKPPAAAKASSAAGTRSKPATWWPAFSRLRAIGPPILPSPTKPIRAMRFPSVPSPAG